MLIQRHSHNFPLSHRSQILLPFDEQLQTVDGRVDERAGPREAEIGARLSVERHHLISFLHSSQEGRTAFFYLHKMKKETRKFF